MQVREMVAAQVIVRGDLEGRRLVLEKGTILEGPICNGTLVCTPGMRVAGPACFTNVCFESPANIASRAEMHMADRSEIITVSELHEGSARVGPEVLQ